jgi:energy-coupling factor transporter ATP-binding protein EcfA2
MELNKDIINKHFKFPIEFEKKINIISDNIKNDFEFNTNNSPYKLIFNSNRYTINNLLIDKWKTYFSNNKNYIKNFQNFILEFNKKYFDKFHDYNDTLLNTFIQHKNNDGFNEKYDYINWKHIEFVNNNKSILQALTYYNLFSPVINLSIPIFLLIMPFIIIKFVLKSSISFDIYKDILCKQVKNHSLGKIFSIFSREITTDKKIFAAISITFYFFSIYQSILTCIKFYNNSFYIQEYLFNIKQHLINSNDKIDSIISIIQNNSYFNQYLDYLVERKNKINVIISELSFLTTKQFNYKNIFCFGDYLAMFYKLRNDETTNETLYFTFNLQCYINNINSICELINKNKINKCNFTKNPKKQHIKQQYYLYHDELIVKNDLHIDKYIITGPNASGKTTLLKTTLLNIIFSQQFGFGFYKKATLIPYRIIDSYINIPDTSGRDSLFQAEARRCLDILNNVKKNKNGYSFIIFDEIYSGTNPYEATTSAKAFLECFQNYNVFFLLTTHFKELTNINNLKNYHMDCVVDKDTNKISYTYKFRKGISHIKGGFKILEDLEYPIEIIKKLN